MKRVMSCPVLVFNIFSDDECKFNSKTCTIRLEETLLLLDTAKPHQTELAFIFVLINLM